MRQPLEAARSIPFSNTEGIRCGTKNANLDSSRRFAASAERPRPPCGNINDGGDAERTNSVRRIVEFVTEWSQEESEMKEKAIFVNPFRMLSPKLDQEALKLETLHEQPVSPAVTLEEGLLIMISKLIEMTRLLSKGLVSGSEPLMSRCQELAQEIDRQEKLLTTELVSSKMRGDLLKGLIRFPYRLERIGDMLESILRCCRLKTVDGIGFSDKAHEELDQLFSVLTDMMVNLRDAFGTPNRVILEYVVNEGRKLSVLVEDAKMAHWERLEHGFCAVEASSMYRDILDSIKASGEYLMLMSSTLLEMASSSPVEAEARPRG